MRHAKVTRELLAGNSNHHVLHQGVKKLVEFSVHQLFGGHAQVNIHGGSGVRQGADRDVIDAGFGKASHRFQCDAARGFQRNPACHHLNGFSRLFGIEIVQKHNICTCVQSPFQLVEITDFDFDLHEVAEVPARFLDCVSDGRVECEVIVLDEYTIK